MRKDSPCLAYHGCLYCCILLDKPEHVFCQRVYAPEQPHGWAQFHWAQESVHLVLSQDLMMTAYCGEYPHMSEVAIEKTRSRVGPDWMEHYGMLNAACDGCLQCVQHYHVKGGCMIADVRASVWTGSFSDTRFNAWRGTFENQSGASLESQEAVRDFLRSLDHAQEKITDTQKKWKNNSLLDHREALMVEAEGKTVACEWSQVAAQAKAWVEYPVAENWKIVSTHRKRQTSEEYHTESYGNNGDWKTGSTHGKTQSWRTVCCAETLVEAIV